MSNRQAARPAAARSDAAPADPANPVAQNDVDTSVLDKLIEITRQQRQLDEFRARAEAKKDKVDAAVYRRVVDDYNGRVATLDEEARPLKTQARKEFEKLRALFDNVNGREERARYDKQELEFRHEVGEMDGTQLAERLKGPEAILAECRAELDGLGRQKARFLEAFDEDELEQPDPVVHSAVPSAAAAPEVPVELAGAPADVTMMQPAPAFAAAPAPAPAIHADADDASDESTFILPEGTLVSRDPALGKDVEYRLSAINYIGRSPDNQIRLATDGVSRRHALVAAEKTGFLIKDLGSQNGTFVNDNQVTECRLNYGDVIKLGEAQLLFTAPRRGV